MKGDNLAAYGDRGDGVVAAGVADCAGGLGIHRCGEGMGLAHAQHRCVGAEGHGFRLGNHGDLQAGGLVVEVLDRDGGGSGSHAHDLVGCGVDLQHAGIAAAQAVLAHARAGVGGDLEGRAIAHAQQLHTGEGELGGSLDDLEGILGSHAVVGGDGDGHAARAEGGDAPGRADGGVAGVGTLEAESAGHAVVGGGDHRRIHLFAHAEGGAGCGEVDPAGLGNDGQGLGAGYAVVGGGSDGDCAFHQGDNLAAFGDRGDDVVAAGVADGAGGFGIHRCGQGMGLAHAQNGRVGAEDHGFRRGNHGDFQAGGLVVEGFGRDGGRAGSDGINAAVLHAKDAFIADGIADSVAVRAGIEAGGQGCAVAHAQRGRTCAELDAAGGAAHRHLAAGGEPAGSGYGDGGAARAHAGDRAAGLVHLDIAGVGAAPAQFAREALGRDRADQAVGHAFARADGEGAGAQGDGFRLRHRDLDRSGHAHAAGGDCGCAGGDGGQRAVGRNFGDGGIAAAPFNGIELAVGVGGGELDLVAGGQLRAGFNRQLQNEARARLRQGVSAVGRCVRGNAQRIQLLCGQGSEVGCVRPGGVGQLLMGEADLRAAVGFVDFRHVDRARVQYGQLRGAAF